MSRVLTALSAEERRHLLGRLLDGGRQAVAPLSPDQEALWTQCMLEPSSTAYNEAFSWRVHDQLDSERLSRALALLVARHEVLGYSIFSNGQSPLQCPGFCSRSIYHEEGAQAATLEMVRERMRLEANRQIDLARGPLFRVHRYVGVQGGDVLLIVAHHLVVDLWSIGVLVSELEELYRLGEQHGLGDVVPYRQYARWQRTMLQGPEGARLRGYWTRRLTGLDPNLALPAPELPAGAAIVRNAGARVERALPFELVKQLRARAAGLSASPSMLFQAAWFAVLHRYTGQCDLALGTPMAGRLEASFDRTVGYFASPVCLRAELAPEQPFAVLVAQVRERVIEALEHQGLPAASLAGELGLQRRLDRHPLFSTLFAWQRPHLLELEPEGSDEPQKPWLELLGFEQEAPKADLFVAIVERAESLEIVFQYRLERFEASFMRTLLDSYVRLLEGVAADVHQPLSELPITSRTWASCAHGPQHPQSQRALHADFEARVREQPDAPAVLTETRLLSYAELDALAQRFATQLCAAGLGAEEVVGLMGERTPELLAALLGILKAGGSYLPLSTSLPDERLAFIASDAELRFVCVTTQHADRSRRVLPDVRVLSANDPALPDAPPPARIESARRAYVIYTSGSTGEPRGVEIEHGAVVDFLDGMKEQLDIKKSDSWLSVSTFGFDISVLEVLLPLSVGARVLLPSESIVRDPVRMIQLLRRHTPSLLQATPSYLRLLLAAGLDAHKSMQVLCGGEAMSADLAQSLAERAGCVWNVYGPTETTIWSSAWRVPLAVERVSIGQPLRNERIYVLDQRQRPVPQGVQGEICIAGRGLARGYFKRPALTQERFIEHTDAATGERLRLYRTGDLGRFLPNGALLCDGRIDNQIKLRGHRIELDEIAAQLTACAGVAAATVTLRSDVDREPCLVAYVVPADVRGAPGELVAALQARLAQKLPAPMLPSYYVALAALPLTQSGKVDRHKLPPPEKVSTGGADCTAAVPTSPYASMLARCFGSVLGLETVGYDDDFFGLGGTSLSAMELSVQAEANGLSLPPEAVFAHPTVRLLAAAIEAQAATGPYAPAETPKEHQP